LSRRLTRRGRLKEADKEADKEDAKGDEVARRLDKGGVASPPMRC
jgi:hypothetical protein